MLTDLMSHSPLLAAAPKPKKPNLSKFEHQPHWHLSLRYDRSESSKERAVTTAMQSAHTLSVTEVWEHRKRLAKYAAERNWGVRQRLDTAVLWSKETWAFVADISESIHGKWTKGSSYVSDNVGVPMVVLRHRTSGVVIVLTATHLQAAVEQDWKGARAVAHRWCSAYIRNKANKVAKRYGATAIIWGADWNLNWKAGWVAQHLASLLPNWWSCWEGSGNAQKGGTHGPRLIDIIFMRGAKPVADSSKIADSKGASDHRFVFTRWRPVAAKRQRPKVRRLAATALRTVGDVRTKVEFEVFVGDDDAHLEPIRVEEPLAA